MKIMKSDWFDHINWRGEEEHQRYLSYRGLDKEVFRLAILQHNTHKIDFEKHEPSTLIFRFNGRPLLTKMEREIQTN